jgi:hypothetical protein
VTIEKIQIDTVKHYADRRYEWVEGTVYFAVDPGCQANQRIVDLDLAPRGDDGLARFAAFSALRKPIALASQSGGLFREWVGSARPDASHRLPHPELAA